METWVAVDSSLHGVICSMIRWSRLAGRRSKAASLAINVDPQRLGGHLGCRRGDTQLDQGCVIQEGLLALLALDLQRAPAGRLSFRICEEMQRIVVAGDARMFPKTKNVGALMVCSDPLLWRSTCPPTLLPEVKQPLSAGREERYRQNDLLPLISYQHHQSWIVVAIVLPQALDCTLRVGKCRRFVRQKCAVGIVLFSSVRPPDGEKISGHCYLIETCPHAREASYTQSMKVTCRDCANACSEFLPRRQQCFGHCEPTPDLRPNHACEPFALENFATKLPRGCSM